MLLLEQKLLLLLLEHSFLEYLMELELYLLWQLLALTLGSDRHAIFVEVAFAVEFAVVLRVLRICRILEQFDNLLSG